MPAAVCWVMTQGEAGMISQALGLAEALGYTAPAIKKIGLRWPWKWAPNWPVLASLKALSIDSDPVQAPWPDLLITCGRKAAFVSLALRDVAPRTTRIHIQNPHASLDGYDLVLVPAHDGVSGSNVIATQGALHRVNAAKLTQGRAEFGTRLAELPRPLVAVLLGGTNRNFRLDATWATGFGTLLRRLRKETGCGLAITPSRRTDPVAVAALRASLGDGGWEIWDGVGPNPYFGYLGTADAVIVTCDSISMVSESCATGKSVYLARLPGHSARFEQFFKSLEEKGLVRWFEGRVDLWDNGRLDDMDDIARQVRARLGNRV